LPAGSTPGPPAYVVATHWPDAPWTAVERRAVFLARLLERLPVGSPPDVWTRGDVQRLLNVLRGIAYWVDSVESRYSMRHRAALCGTRDFATGPTLVTEIRAEAGARDKELVIKALLEAGRDRRFAELLARYGRRVITRPVRTFAASTPGRSSVSARSLFEPCPG
jgi:hypothetical protein